MLVQKCHTPVDEALNKADVFPAVLAEAAEVPVVPVVTEHRPRVGAAFPEVGAVKEAEEAIMDIYPSANFRLWRAGECVHCVRSRLRWA